jgi:transposase
VPQNDESLRKLIKNREQDSYEPDYSVKYALNKLFIQIYESQVALEIKGNFEIEPDEASKKKSWQGKLGL